MQAPKTALSKERIDQLLSECALHTATAMGSFEHPRTSTDPLVDAAAWQVAKAIMHEPSQNPHLLRQRYAFQVPVDERGQQCPAGEAARLSWEWNPKKLINDRIWNWMQFHAHDSTAKDGKLGPGKMTVDVFYRCDSICQEGHVNLLHAAAKPKSPTAASLGGRRTFPLSLTACPASGLVHLCRATPSSCHSLGESGDSTLVCLASGHVCLDQGVGTCHPSQKIDMANGERGRAFELWKNHMRLDARDPENARRVRAIELQQKAGCPHIVDWDPVMGILTLHVPALSERQEESPPFDPTFMWTHAPPPPRPSEQAPQPASDCIGMHGLVTRERQQRKVAQKRRARTSRLQKRLRATRQHVQDRGSAASASTSPRDLRLEIMLQQERQVVERVLHDILWDVVARRHSNAYFVKTARKAAQSDIQAAVVGGGQSAVTTMGPVAMPVAPTPHTTCINSLLEALAARKVTTVANNTSTTGQDARPLRLLSLDQVHQQSLAAAREHLAPLIAFDKNRHEHLVCATLYLWRYIMHQPLTTNADSDSEGQKPFFSTFRDCQRQRRNSNAGSATLAQFTLGVLYTAASCGLYIKDKPGWPRDGWLDDVLPSVKTLQFYGSQEKLGTRIALDDSDCGDRLTASMQRYGRVSSPLFPTAAAAGEEGAGEAAQTRFHRNGKPKGYVGLYQMKDVTAGKRAVSRIVRNYSGQIPTGQEASRTLEKFYWQAVAPQAQTSQSETQTTEGSVVITRTKRRRIHRHPLSASSSSNNGYTNSNCAVMFSCLFVTRNQRRVHICRMNNPLGKDAVPPGLSAKLMRRDGWRLDTVVGPFPLESQVRAFSVAWGQVKCRHLAERREFGIRLARRVGKGQLGVWVQDGLLDPSERLRAAAAQSRAKKSHHHPGALAAPVIRSTAGYSAAPNAPSTGLVPHNGSTTWDASGRAPVMPNIFTSLAWPDGRQQQPQHATPLPAPVVRSTAEPAGHTPLMPNLFFGSMAQASKDTGRDMVIQS